MIHLNFITIEEAVKLNKALTGVHPSENRVLVFTPNNDEVTNGGIIIPGNIKEGKPRKGVAILRGELDENHRSYSSLTDVGMIITYGLYAGKEVEFDPKKYKFNEEILSIINRGTFTVLDTTEIVMSEFNFI